jgi:hypothetical protein
LHIAVRDFVGFGVDQFDITDGVRGILDRAGDALTAFAAEAHRPVHRRTFADLSFPFIADLREIISPTVSCAAAFGSVDDDDLIRRKLDAFVGASDHRVIPLSDLAEVYSRQRVRSEIQGGVDAGDVVRRNYATQHGGKVQDAGAVLVLVGLELVVVHGAIGGAEIDGAFGDLLDAASRANGLVIDEQIGVLLVVFIKPF